VQKTSLTALARTEMQSALRASSGRSAKTVYGGHEHRLRQTLIALKANETLAEHENPGEATVLVVQGRILLTAGEEEWSGWTGDLIIVPDAPHSVTAVEDSSILLTVVKLG
jgi:quercetin dioxygenase-like cupin family protein